MSGEAADPEGSDPGISAADSPPAESTEVPSARTSVAASPARASQCPSCGGMRIWDDAFCERCGHAFVVDAVDDLETSVEWVAVIGVDRVLFERGEWRGIDFPEDAASRQVTLAGPELQIGRGGLSSDAPDLELDDPAVSRLHAVLVRRADGSYSLVDKGSTNGTTLNDDATPLAPNVVVSLGDGDRIHVGAWTTITLVRRADHDLR